MRKAKRKFKQEPAIRWYRPKAKNTDITVVSEITGYKAVIPTVKGGGAVLIHSRRDGEFCLTTFKDEVRHYFNMGELEAIALIYARLQETK